jgi:hypothetical protein
VQISANDTSFTPLPTNEWMDFTISKQEEQENYADKSRKVLNVEFSINAPGLDRRKVWKNYGPYWPRVNSDKTTMLFDLVKSVDPTEAVKGQDYETSRLVGKQGRLMVVDYESKTKKNPDGTPMIKQKVSMIAPRLESAKPVVAAPKVEVAHAGTKVRF